MEKRKSAVESLKCPSRKQLPSGKRLGPIMISNGSAADAKKLTVKDLEEACRRLTPSARDAATGPRARPRAQQSNAKSAASEPGSVSQLSTLDSGVKLCARKYNECKAQADKLEEELGRRIDQHSELEREAAVLRDMINGNNPDAKKIAKLTRDIEEVGKQSDGKLRYRLQLNYMHQRQRRNSVSLDAHVSAMSATLSSAERERQRCEKMLGEVESALTAATRELEATIRGIEVDRSERHRALGSKRLEANNAERLEEWRHERESSRHDLEQSLGGTYRLEKDKRLNRIQERERELDQLNKATETKTSAFGSLEESFTHIKRATGVNSLAEMVEKFTNFQEHRDRLLQEKKEAEERLNSTKTSLDLAHEKYDRIKANGFGDTELNRQIIDDINSSIAKERVEGKVVKSTNVRLEGVLVGLRQGGMGLYQRLLPFHPTLLDGDAPNLSESATASAIQAAHDTLEMLKVTEQILGKMLDAVGGVQRVAQQCETENQAKVSTDALENPNLGDNNCRIKAKESTPRMPDDEVDNTSAFFADLPADDANIGETIPSRISMKAKSEQQAGEARKRAALEERRQKMKERELSMEDNAEASNKTAIMKMQAESTARMAKHNVPKGLPQTVSLRDDPLTKAQAFLTEMPCLD